MGEGAVTAGGITWVTDRPYAQGNILRTVNPVTAASVSEIYQTERWADDLSYAIPVENGEYELTLHFAEIYSRYQGANQRVFSIQLEGGEVVSSLDVFAESGGFTGMTKTFTVEVTDGMLDITTSQIAGDPAFAAIQLRRWCTPIDPCYQNFVTGGN